jgi:serine O-acetyltransferase
VTYELPSQEALSLILEGLSAALFPRHFGPPSLTEEEVDYFIRCTLDGVLQSLLEQVRRELKLASVLPDDGSLQREERASRITREFAANLPNVRALLESDILAAFQGDPAAQSIDEVLFCYPGVVAIIRHRLSHELYELGAPLLARIIAEMPIPTRGSTFIPAPRLAAASSSTTAPVLSSARLRSSAGRSACIRA